MSVAFCKQNQKWQARIYNAHKRYHIGYYATREEAEVAYKKIAELNQDEFFQWWETTSKKREGAKHFWGSNGSSAKLSDADVLEIKRLHASGVKQKSIATQFNVHCSWVSRLLRDMRKPTFESMNN